MIVGTLQVPVEKEVFGVMAEREYSGEGHWAIPKKGGIIHPVTSLSFSKCLFQYC